MSYTKSFLSIASACLLLFVTSSVYATVIYTYTGNNFDTFNNESGGASSYDSTMNVTVTLEYTSLLPTNLTEQFVAPLSFSISDGINTIDDTNFSSRNILVGTDSSGNINSWFVYATTFLGTGNSWYIETINSNRTFLVWDYGRTTTNALDDTAYIRDNPGSWSVATVPETSIIWLLGTGLVLIGFARRKLS